MFVYRGRLFEKEAVDNIDRKNTLRALKVLAEQQKQKEQ